MRCRLLLRTGAERLSEYNPMNEGYDSFARVATKQLQGRLVWVTTLMYPTASEGRRCILAMLFWVIAVLSVVGVLAIVWGLYMLVRRWL